MRAGEYFAGKFLLGFADDGDLLMKEGDDGAVLRLVFDEDAKHYVSPDGHAWACGHVVHKKVNEREWTMVHPPYYVPPEDVPTPEGERAALEHLAAFAKRVAS